MKTRGEIARDECTHNPIFLLQRRRWTLVNVPEGYSHDGEGVTVEGCESDGYLSWDDLVRLGEEQGDCCYALPHWDTERVFYTREEATAFATSHAYNYRDGWQVECVPAYGHLGTVLAAVDDLLHLCLD